MKKLLISVVVALAFAAGVAADSNAQGGWDFATAVANCRRQGEMRQLSQWVSSSTAPAPDLAGEFASYLAGGSRWFSKGSYSSDPIDAVSAENGFVLISYRRNGTRWGYARMVPYRVGPYCVLLCDWWQQSKKHDQHVPIPSLPIPGGLSTPGFSLNISWMWRDDSGGCIYVFQQTGAGFVHVTGTGCDYGDGATNPNWLTGNTGR